MRRENRATTFQRTDRRVYIREILWTLLNLQLVAVTPSPTASCDVLGLAWGKVSVSRAFPACVGLLPLAVDQRAVASPYLAAR